MKTPEAARHTFRLIRELGSPCAARRLPVGLIRAAVRYNPKLMLSGEPGPIGADTWSYGRLLAPTLICQEMWKIAHYSSSRMKRNNANANSKCQLWPGSWPSAHEFYIWPRSFARVVVSEVIKAPSQVSGSAVLVVFLHFDGRNVWLRRARFHRASKQTKSQCSSLVVTTKQVAHACLCSLGECHQFGHVRRLFSVWGDYSPLSVAAPTWWQMIRGFIHKDDDVVWKP
jgi:hypothetical protein